MSLKHLAYSILLGSLLPGLALILDGLVALLEHLNTEELVVIADRTGQVDLSVEPVSDLLDRFDPRANLRDGRGCLLDLRLGQGLRIYLKGLHVYHIIERWSQARGQGLKGRASLHRRKVVGSRSQSALLAVWIESLVLAVLVQFKYLVAETGHVRVSSLNTFLVNTLCLAIINRCPISTGWRRFS